MTDTPDNTSKTNDFFAAARRQQKIEAQVAAQGEASRAALERQAVLEQGGAAAERLRAQEEKERQLQKIQACADSEIGQIIDVLENLPADSAARRFVVTREHDLAMGGSVTIRAHYATADEAKEGLSFVKTDTPAFRIWFSGSLFDSEKAPTICFYDYSRLAKDGSTYPDPARTEAADGADLRALVGSCIARIAPHRLDDIAAALTPVAPEPAALSHNMTLRAPRAPTRTAGKSS